MIVHPYDGCRVKNICIFGTARMSQAVHSVGAKWRRRDEGDGLVLVTATDAAWLWGHGFYGVSPDRDPRKTPLYGTLSLCEAHYLLVKTERDTARGEEGHGVVFVLHDAADEAVAYSSRDLLGEVWSRGRTASYHRMLAYAHLRDRGWIVQYGLNYGADFLLYRASPKVEHAAFTVVVRGLSRDKEGVVHEPSDDLTWQQAAGLSRVATAARKRLLIAYVTAGSGDANGQPSCRFLQILRWNLGTHDKDEHDD